MKKTNVIAICNQKGGVGKTATAVSMGIALTENGKKVLLVDFDPQGDATYSLGWKNYDKLEHTIASLMKKIIKKRIYLNQNIKNNSSLICLCGGIGRRVGLKIQ